MEDITLDVGSEVTKLGTNNAVCVDLVLRGSPASTSDIFEGDFILEINDQKLNSPMDYYKLIEKLEGQKISLLLMRGSSKMTKEVQLNILK
jgi:S1-C subfamily serine protease